MRRVNPMKVTPFLTVLLILSVCVNVFFLGIYIPANQKQVSGLLDRIQVLDRENTRLDTVVLQQPDYRHQLMESPGGLPCRHRP